MKLAGKDIKLAIFDLDGTLINSTGIWADIDKEFFARRGMEVPKGYAQEIVHLGMEKGAAMTVKRYLPNEKPEDLLREWHEAAKKAYLEDVDLKLAVDDVMDLLLAHDVHLALATVNDPELYIPCLKRLQILDYFEEIADVNAAPEGKTTSKIYDDLAAKFGVTKDNVIIFEDAISALKTAYGAGYTTVAVYDVHSTKDEYLTRDYSHLFIREWFDFLNPLKDKHALPEIQEGIFRLRRFNRGYEILGITDFSIEDLHIPKTILDRPVYKVGDNAFEKNNFKKIILEEGLRAIGNSAFYESRQAKEIIIPASVRETGYCAFSSSAFERVEFKGYVKHMFSSFSGLNQLKELVFSSDFEYLPFRGFWFNGALEEINLPEGVVRIGDQAFNKCDSLRKVIIPHSTQRIYSNAFYRCPNLSEVYYHGSEEDWAKISIDEEGNEIFLKAKRFYI